MANVGYSYEHGRSSCNNNFCTETHVKMNKQTNTNKFTVWCHCVCMVTIRHDRECTCMTKSYDSGVGFRFSRHSPEWRVTQNFYSPNQRKTRQNYVFAEHLYSVHKLLANSKIHSHLASWRVVIRTAVW
jgi:hypothetical protein